MQFAKPGTDRILLQRAAIFDGVSDRLLLPSDVLIEGNEIAMVSQEPLPTDDVRVIDCRGKTVMPGLIDAHVHVYASSLNFSPPTPPPTYRAQYANQYLRNLLDWGYTSVRDVGGGDRGLARAISEGLLPAPRFFYGGKVMSQTGGHGDMRSMDHDVEVCGCCAAGDNWIASLADGEDECRKAAREELRKGASHIKIMGSGGVMSPGGSLQPQYSEAEIRVIVDECERRGVYACAHCHPAEAIRRCVQCGVRCIEHGTLIDAPTADLVAAAEAFVVPTMAVLQALKDDGLQMGMTRVSHDKLLRVHESALIGLGIMKSAGVRMGLGTDLIGAQHERQGTELTIRSQALSNTEILKSATSINAEILQMKGRLGVVQVGALADLLVVDGDPIADIRLLAQNGRHLTHVILDGRFAKKSISDS